MFRVLITNLTMAGRTGTEIVTRDLALGLLRAGDRPVVYTPEVGALADELRAASIPVVRDIDRLEDVPDVIHGHHTTPCAIAAARFPATPAVFVCHDFLSWYDSPPRLPNVRRFAAISAAFLERLTSESGIAPQQARLLLNGVDTERFAPGAEPPARPRRALAFAKTGGHVSVVRAACAEAGIELDLIGAAVGRTVDRPEALLPDYDMVFASALSAVEAIACLRPTIVCDGRGLGGFVDEERYGAWRSENFGLRVLTQRLTLENLRDEIARYDPAAAARVGTRLRKEAELGAWISQCRDLYREAIEDMRRDPPSAEAHARAGARFLQTWLPTLRPALPWDWERAALIRRIDELEAELEPLPLDRPVPGSDSAFLDLRGFHAREPWGAWSKERTCSIRVRLPDGLRSGRLRIWCNSFRTPSRPRFEVRALVNGVPCGGWVDEGLDGQPTYRFIDLPDLAEERGEPIWVTFQTSPPIAPETEGLSEDARPLALGLLQVMLEARTELSDHHEERDPACGQTQD